MDCYYSGDHIYYTLSAIALLTLSLSTNVYYCCSRRRSNRQHSTESQSENENTQLNYTSSSFISQPKIQGSLPDWARTEFLQQRNMN